MFAGLSFEFSPDQAGRLLQTDLLVDDVAGGLKGYWLFEMRLQKVLTF